MNAEEQMAFYAGQLTTNSILSDKELSSVIKHYKLTLAFFDGLNGDTNFYGLVTSRLRQELSRYESYREYRKRG